MGTVPGTRLTPIVLVTALNDTASRIRGIEAGADDFLSKPFRQHTVIGEAFGAMVALIGTLDAHRIAHRHELRN